MERIIPQTKFSGAKALIRLAITRAVLNPSEDEILDLVFSNPVEALRSLDITGALTLSKEDENELILFGKNNFSKKFEKLEMETIIKRLVDTEDRLDMPDVVRL